MTQTFREGQKVRIRKPSNVKQWPVWIGNMDQFDGTIVAISGVIDSKSGTYFWFHGNNGYKFNVLWAQPIEAELEYI